MTRIALGTAQFGLDYGISNNSGQVAKEDVLEIINIASLYGITALDTASKYGNAEDILGNIHLNRFDIVTKFIPETKELTLEKQLINSLNNLKISQVYGYIAHEPKYVFEQKNVWDKLNKFKEQGKVKKIGFSIDYPDEYFIMKKKRIYS